MRAQCMVWDGGVCQGSAYEEGFPVASPDLYGEEASGGHAMLLQHPYGFLGRPADPDGSGACQALYAWEGSQGHVIPTLDKRVLEKLPENKKGGSVQYGFDGGFGQFNPETHTWTLYIPTDFDSSGTPTKAHLLQIGKDTNGKRCVTLLHADGPAITILEGGKRSVVIKNAASDAFLEVNDDGITLNGKTTIKGGLKAAEGAGVAPVARATELAAWAGLVTVAINALVAKVNALPPVSTIPPVPPLVASVASTTLSG